MSDLPYGWEQVSLINLVAPDGIFSDGDWIESKDQDPNGSIRLLQLADIGDGIFLGKSKRFINETKFEELRCVEIFENDVLVARMPSPLGRACLMPKLSQRCITVVDVAVIRLGKHSVSSRWLKYFLNSPVIRQKIDALSSGTTRQRISKKNLEQLTLPVPPLNEQERIANKLDTLLVRVDACRDRLESLPITLENFRQSVITLAMSGKLTENLRKTKWENVVLKDICLSISDGDHQAPPQVKQGIPFITIGAINDKHLDLNKAKRFVPYSYFEKLKEHQKPQLGDILFSVTGSIAIPALVNTSESFVFQRHIAILKPDLSLVTSKFLFYLLCTTKIKNQAVSVATGTAQKTIPLSKLRMFSIDIPSVAEQQEIIKYIDTMLIYADRIEHSFKQAASYINYLTPSLLYKAFCGELVPQDPNDEPASILLERIHAERIANPSIIKRDLITRKPKMSKMTNESVKKIVDELPSDAFSFEDLHKKLAGDYDSFKDILFELLDEDEPSIEQMFDKQAKAIHFIRKQK